MIRSFLALFVLLSIAVTAHAFDVEKLILDGASRIRESAPRDEAGQDEAPQPSKSRPSAPAAGEDDHFIQPDDVFIAERPLGSHAWISVQLAKVTTAPSPQTKDEGEFFRVTDGTSHWTRHYWKTRIARSDEIKLGAVMIMFEGRSSKGVYQAPDKKSSARRDNWFMAKITDTSDLYKGYVTVSGGYKTSPANLRVIVR